jgi:hypothetical protein
MPIEYGYYLNLTRKTVNNMEDLTPYIEIDWSGVCEDYDLKHGDISPHQTFEIDLSLNKINEVLNEFINQNR